MLLSLVLLNLAVVMGLAALRYPGPASRFVTPALQPAGPWPLGIAGVLALVGVLLGVVGIRRARRRAAVVAWAESLTVFASLLAIIWLLPAKPRHFGGAGWLCLGGWLGLAVGLFVRHRADRRELLRRLGTGIRPPRALVIWTAVLAAVPVTVGLALDVPVDPGKLAVSVITYPLYALVQMGLFLVFLLPRLRRMGLAPGPRAAAAPWLFAILHWPNGPVMLATLVGGFVWAAFYVRRTHLLWLAVSMGIAASCFTRFLPHTFTQNMRTGPIFVERGLEWHRFGPPRP